MQAYLNKVKKWGIISDDTSIDDILDEIDYGLFKKMQFSNQCLHHILSAITYMVWKCGREDNYNLHIWKTEIARK